MTTPHQKLSTEIEARIKSQIHPDVRIGNNVMDVILDVIDERLAAMAACIAERDQQLVRLRREMDALREGLRSAHDPELIAHDVMVAAKGVAP